MGRVYVLVSSSMFLDQCISRQGLFCQALGFAFTILKTLNGLGLQFSSLISISFKKGKKKSFHTNLYNSCVILLWLRTLEMP